MPNILFIDDSPEIYNVAFSILQATQNDMNVYLSSNVRSTIRLLCDVKFDLIILDVYIPIGEGAEDTLGGRAKMYEGEFQHLGGLELIDFLDKMENRPKVLMHTACFDYDIISMFNPIVDDRIPKPASIDVFINTIVRALNL